MILIKIIIVLFIIEVILAFLRSLRRRSEFKKALKLKEKKGKPLLVIGSPFTGGYNTLFGIDYDCGDICIDLIGCDSCKKSIKTDALSYLKKLPSNSHVIYESCVLENIQDKSVINNLIKEIKRVSGGDYLNVRVGFALINYFYFPHFYDKSSRNFTRKGEVPKY